MSIEISILGPEDMAVLEQVDPDVFDNAVDPALSARFLADPRHHLAVARDDGIVVGMASAVHYLHPDKAEELWINEVGVAVAYRRLGVGRRLLEALFDVGRQLGCGEAWVATEPDNEAARSLYSAVGGEAEAAVVYAVNLKTR